MTDAETPRTAADVLREHCWYVTPDGELRCRGCSWASREAQDNTQHQEDMLAAAGLLATAEHDQSARLAAYREWFCADPVAARGYWQVPCDDCQGTGRFPVPEGYDGDPSCVQCKATGWVLLSMADPGADEALAEHDREVAARALRDAASAWMSEMPPGAGVDDWGRGWLACRDAVVYDLGTTRAERIAAGEEP